MKLHKSRARHAALIFLGCVCVLSGWYYLSNLPTRGPLALVGDSRLNGDWNVLLGRTDIVNLSVAGSRAADWKARAQENLALIPPNVTKVIIQFGKNDIDAETPPEVITQNIQDIVTLIETTRAIKVGVLAPLPVTATKAGMEYTNPKTKKLLPYLEKIHATYYEGYETLVIDGVLLPRYTDDGSHLNAAGKAIYKDTITALEAKL